MVRLPHNMLIKLSNIHAAQVGHSIRRSICIKIIKYIIRYRQNTIGLKYKINTHNSHQRPGNIANFDCIYINLAQCNCASERCDRQIIALKQNALLCIIYRFTTAPSQFRRWLLPHTHTIVEFIQFVNVRCQKPNENINVGNQKLLK